MRKHTYIIKNKFGITPQLEAIFTVAIIISATAVAAIAVKNFVSSDTENKKTIETIALEVSALLTNTGGQSSDGSQNWYENPDTVKSIGLKADLDAETLLDISYAVGLTSVQDEEETNHAPTTPILTGENGTTGVELTFTAVSSDEDESDQIKYIWNWDDSNPDEETVYYDSNVVSTITHSFSLIQCYSVKVIAEDTRGKQSEAATILVSIGDGFPDVPDTPTVDGALQVGGQYYLVTINGTEYLYATTTTDPNGDKIDYGWDWNADGIVNEWDDKEGLHFNSNEPVKTPHTYTEHGLYNVQVRARDVGGLMSGFSGTLGIFNDNAPDKPSEPFYYPAGGGGNGGGYQELPAEGSNQYTLSTVTSDEDNDCIIYRYKYTNLNTGFIETLPWSIIPTPSGDTYLDIITVSEGYVPGATVQFEVQARSVYILYSGGNGAGSASYIYGAISEWSDPHILTLNGGGGLGVCCFPAGTLIDMADGTKKCIEQITRCDMVLSYDLENSMYTVGEVNKTIHVIKKGIYNINDGLINPSNDHPLYIRKTDGYIGWASAVPESSKKAYSNIPEIRKLEVGDELFTTNGWIKIESIGYIPGTIDVYTFALTRYHHYFANSIMAHNAFDEICGGANGTMDPYCICYNAGTCCGRNAKGSCICIVKQLACGCGNAPMSSSGPCFIAGSKILMNDGSLKNIEEIQIGDIITNYDIENKTFALDTVVEVFHHTPEELISNYYLIINKELKVTPNHPLYMNKEWINASELQVGDMLPSGNPIESIERVDGKTPTYHMLTETYHNYVVAFGEDYVIAKNGNPAGVYVVGGYDEDTSANSEMSQLDQATKIAYSSVLSMNKVFSLGQIQYSKFKEIFKLEDFRDINIRVTRIGQEDQVYLAYGPGSDERTIDSVAGQVAVKTENVILYARQQTSEYSQEYIDMYIPCELTVFVY